ncbi:MAG: hypothetical protein EBV77_11050 [Gemmatimonadaceae bacterium]|nr:hypothetical protein [Gemmatimonadaceae bacterium]
MSMHSTDASASIPDDFDGFLLDAIPITDGIWSLYGIDDDQPVDAWSSFHATQGGGPSGAHARRARRMGSQGASPRVPSPDHRLGLEDAGVRRLIPARLRLGMIFAEDVLGRYDTLIGRGQEAVNARVERVRIRSPQYRGRPVTMRPATSRNPWPLPNTGQGSVLGRGIRVT